MADQGHKSEKPTQARIRKARAEGRFPASKDLIAAIHFAAALALGVAVASSLLSSLESAMVALFHRAFSTEPLTAGTLITLLRSQLAQPARPLLQNGALLFAITLLFQLVTTGFGLSGKQLLPSFERLKMGARLRQLPRQNLFSASKAVLLLPIIGFVLYAEIYKRLPELANLATAPLGHGVTQAAATIRGILWPLALALLGLGLLDFARQRQRFQAELRMTKQEVKDELKEGEGNPHIKLRIRRLQREAARRSMLKAIPKATAVVVNPTHYAIALYYEMNSKAVPQVVAKGKNYLAQAIREKALEHDIPIIENKPLAQALYEAVEVGHEIPPHLYRAVAEVLAYIYRILSRR